MTTISPVKKTIDNFLESMWKDYCLMNPQANEIYSALIKKGNEVRNDHIALRTFNHPLLGIKSLAQHFEKYGYTDCGEYFFNEKKLYAKHYENKNQPDLPKIFISELELEKMSPFVQTTLNQLVESIKPETISSENFVYEGKYWDINYQTYLKLAKESEYASWVYVFGFRPNHFTVNINSLKSFDEVSDINLFIKKMGYKLNTSGGEIKGTAADYLEQSSTMAFELEIQFDEGVFLVPSCYYEFAKRYMLSNGQYYQGFVAKSADKIFESTHKIQD